MRTLALDDKNWDLMVDDYGNLAIKESNDCLAQDVASSVMVWKNELPFDRLRGIPYGSPEELNGVLGFEVKKQAKLIDGVKNVSVIFEKLEDRGLNMTIYVENENGEVINVQ